MMNKNRYENMTYRKLGKSGLKLPMISLGLWYGYGDVDRFDNAKNMILTAFDLGITH
ncbi:MAG TPA: L-glyceraldehyde 3-phosphate reductase, partial [Clostridiales bacterium UBA8960]|nr:L-glyceraldehyde 3-phosphate reductase [Clostridiales bacterium UBA8960]